MEHDTPPATPDLTSLGSEPSSPPLATALATAEAIDPPPFAPSVDGAHEPLPLVHDPLEADDALVQAITTLSAEMAALRRDFDAKIKYDQSKDRLLDTLHAELQTHREGLTFRILRPVLLDLIGLYDDLANLAADSPDMAPATRSPKTMAQEGIVEILERYGANAYVTVAGTAVESSRQRAINVIATDDPAQDGIVAQSLRPGFEYEGRVLRTEWIAAYRYSSLQRENTTGGDGEHV